MSKQLCPECGKTKPAGAPDGACPACLLTLGLAAALPRQETSVLPPLAEPGDRIGRYKLLEQIGEGGFGTVWMAEQQEPVRRLVALKILKLGMDTKEVVARFEAERQALAMMDHPNIAKVLDAGATERGRPYFVMELVAGVPITSFCDTRRLNTRERIELFVLVCEAVQHAHQKGVIHRDLKPGNILVSGQDGRMVPKVIDFGVAKAIDEPLTDKTFFTRLGQFLGTPAYMSPEQAGLGGQDIDTRSDIYSLGVLLYELLTGGPPFDPRQFAAQGWEAILKMIREHEPPKPSTRLTTLAQEELEVLAGHRREPPQQFPRALRGELDCITLKAIEKDRRRRYATAHDLAADLKRFLDGELVQAAPPTLAYQLRKFVRKHRAGVAVAGVSALLLCLVAAGGVWEAVREKRRARVETQLRHRAESNELHLRHTVHAADTTLAAQALERGDDEAARQILAPYLPEKSNLDLRGWEWRHLWSRAQGAPSRALTGHSNTITAVAFFDQGRRLLSAGHDGTIREWDFASGRELRRWSRGVQSWSALAVHPSGTNAVAIGGGAALVINLVDGTQIEGPSRRGGFSLLASPDGQAYVRGTGGGFISTNGQTFVHDLSLAASRPLPQSGSRCAFSSDGKLLATGTWADRIRLWTWPELQSAGELGPVGWIASLDFSPDGRWLVSGAGTGELSLWDVAAKTLRQRRAAHGQTTLGTVKFSPDGRRIATAGGDQTLVIWDAEKLDPLRTLRGSVDQVWQVQWAPDGRSLVSTTRGAGLRVWPLDEPEFPVIDHLSDSAPVRFSPDSKWMAAEFNNDDGAGLWSVADGRQHGRIHRDRVLCGFLPEQDLILLEEWNTNAWLFCRVPTLEIVKQVPLEKPPGNARKTTTAQMSSDGRWVAWTYTEGMVLIRDVETGAIHKWFQAHPGGVRKVNFSRDNRWLVSCGSDQVARVWDTKTWTVVRTLRGPAAGLWETDFSPDGRRVVVGSINGDYAVFDRESGEKLMDFHTGEDGSALFPEGSRTLITIGFTRLRFWNLEARREAGALSLGGPGGQFVSRSPDASVLATVLRDGVLRLIRAPAHPVNSQ